MNKVLRFFVVLALVAVQCGWSIQPVFASEGPVLPTSSDGTNPSVLNPQFQDQNTGVVERRSAAAVLSTGKIINKKLDSGRLEKNRMGSTPPVPVTSENVQEHQRMEAESNLKTKEDADKINADKAAEREKKFGELKKEAEDILKGLPTQDEANRLGAEELEARRTKFNEEIRRIREEVKKIWYTMPAQFEVALGKEVGTAAADLSQKISDKEKTAQDLTQRLAGLKTRATALIATVGTDTQLDNLLIPALETKLSDFNLSATALQTEAGADLASGFQTQVKPGLDSARSRIEDKLSSKRQAEEKINNLKTRTQNLLDSIPPIREIAQMGGDTLKTKADAFDASYAVLKDEAASLNFTNQFNETYGQRRDLIDKLFRFGLLDNEMGEKADELIPMESEKLTPSQTESRWDQVVAVINDYTGRFNQLGLPPEWIKPYVELNDATVSFLLEIKKALTTSVELQDPAKLASFTPEKLNQLRDGFTNSINQVRAKVQAVGFEPDEEFLAQLTAPTESFFREVDLGLSTLELSKAYASRPLSELTLSELTAKFENFQKEVSRLQAIAPQVSPQSRVQFNTVVESLTVGYHRALLFKRYIVLFDEWPDEEGDAFEQAVRALPAERRTQLREAFETGVAAIRKDAADWGLTADFESAWGADIQDSLDLLEESTQDPTKLQELNSLKGQLNASLASVPPVETLIDMKLADLNTKRVELRDLAGRTESLASQLGMTSAYESEFKTKFIEADKFLTFAILGSEMEDRLKTSFDPQAIKNLTPQQALTRIEQGIVELQQFKNDVSALGINNVTVDQSVALTDSLRSFLEWQKRYVNFAIAFQDPSGVGALSPSQAVTLLDDFTRSLDNLRTKAEVAGELDQYELAAANSTDVVKSLHGAEISLDAVALAKLVPTEQEAETITSAGVGSRLSRFESSYQSLKTKASGYGLQSELAQSRLDEVLKGFGLLKLSVNLRDLVTQLVLGQITKNEFASRGSELKAEAQRRGVSTEFDAVYAALEKVLGL